MQNQNTITIMLHSQNFDIKIEDSFTIFLSVSLHNDFKNTNITRQEILSAYISKVYELYKMEKEVDEILECLERQEFPLPITDSEVTTVIT